MKKKLLILLSMTAMASMAMATQTPDPKRMDALWDVATSRMVRQNDAWFKFGDYPRIVRCLQYLHEIEPADLDTTSDLGWMLENIDRNSEALALYIDYREKNPTVAGAEFMEANFYYLKKLYSKIPPLIEPRIAAKHATQLTFRLLAHSYEKMNLFEDAKRTWETYLSLVPDDVAAQLNLKKVENKLKGVPAAPTKPGTRTGL